MAGNLWHAMQDAIGYNGNGHCCPWSIFMLKLAPHVDLELSWRSSNAKVHYFISAHNLRENTLVVKRSALESCFEDNDLFSYIKNSTLSHDQYVGVIDGHPGEDVILDGTCGQFDFSLSMGLYCNFQKIPLALRDMYTNSFVLDPKIYLQGIPCNISNTCSPN